MPFLGKLGPKNQNSHFKLKLGTYTDSRMQNSMVMLILSVFDWKDPFLANLVQNIKIITLCWNFVPTLIRIRRIQWCDSIFLFLSGNTLFGQTWSKKSKFSLWAKIGDLHWFENAEFNGDVHFILFFFLIGNTLLGQI